jgi:hypothetical protein
MSVVRDLMSYDLFAFGNGVAELHSKSTGISVEHVVL